MCLKRFMKINKQMQQVFSFLTVTKNQEIIEMSLYFLKLRPKSQFIRFRKINFNFMLLMHESRHFCHECFQNKKFSGNFISAVAYRQLVTVSIMFAVKTAAFVIMSSKIAAKHLTFKLEFVLSEYLCIPHLLLLGLLKLVFI